MLVIREETIRVFSLSVARTPMVKIAKTLRNACWFLGDKVKIL